MAKTRIPIPVDIEASVLFKAEHICSKCRNSRLDVQIHHIDGDPSNNKENNLMVLCLQDHSVASSKSTMSKGYTQAELKKYKEDWESIVKERREALREPSKITLVRFDGPDVNTIFLQTKEGVLRGFQDSQTFEHLGFNWGNVDVYPVEDKKKFTIEPPLTRLRDCPQIRLKYQSGGLANEVFLIWDDGRKHHIPDPETLKIVGGKEVEEVGNEKFNAFPHGEPLKSIFEVRTNTILKDAMEKHLSSK